MIEAIEQFELILRTRMDGMRVTKKEFTLERSSALIYRFLDAHLRGLGEVLHARCLTLHTSLTASRDILTDLIMKEGGILL